MSITKTKVEQSTTIDGKKVKEIGSMYELTFYRAIPCGDDYIYVARHGFVIGTIECSMAQGYGFIENIEEVP